MHVVVASQSCGSLTLSEEGGGGGPQQNFGQKRYHFIPIIGKCNPFQMVVYVLSFKYQ